MNIGGPAHHVAILCSAFNNERWESILATGNVSASEADAGYLLESSGCRKHTIPEMQRPLHFRKDTIACWKIFRILLEEHPDILHTHTSKAGALGRTVGILYRILTGRPLKMVHTFHGHALEGYFGGIANRFFLGVERFLSKRTDRLIAVSNSVKRELVHLKVAPPKKIDVIPLGLALEPFFQINGGGSNTRPFRIGFVGRLVPIKEPQLLLEALANLARSAETAPFEAVLAGDGELRHGLEKQAEKLGLTDKVRFLGWQRDLPQVYGSLDLVCLTSRNEGTPVSLIESLAASRAAISTDVGGVRELLNGNEQAGRGSERGFEICEHGLLVRSGDAEGLAEAIRFLMKESSLRQEMGRRGRGYVRAKYGADRLVRDVERLYESLVPDSAP